MNNAIKEICRTCAHEPICCNKTIMNDAIGKLKKMLETDGDSLLTKTWKLVNLMSKVGISFVPQCSHYLNKHDMED